MGETPKEEEAGRRGRRRSINSSPEFEFWVTRDPEPDQLLSADELFADGILLPLHRLHANPDPKPAPPPTPQPNHSLPAPSSTTRPDPDPVQPAETSSSSSSSSILLAPTSGLTASKRWKDILFKKPAAQADYMEKKKKTKSRNKNGGSNSGSGSGSAELNINIWPFSRSRSAGNGANRPKLVPPRKVSSAPCSRSNSAGESKSRKWPSSPGRVHGGGVHLGRSSPVWQVRRSGSRGSNSSGLGSIYSANGSSEEVMEAQRGKKVHVTGDGDSSEGGSSRRGNNSNNRAMVLNLNVPKCIGYGQHLGACRADQSTALDGGSAGDRSAGGGNLFNLRSLFSKKVY